MNIIIIGAGNVGYYLTRSLLASGHHEIKIIEKDVNRCILAADRLDVPVVRGDGTQLAVLEKQNVKKADIVVALTGKDEDNFIAAQLAKQHFHVKTTIAKANNPKNLETMKKIAADIVISSANMLASIIEQEVDAVNFRFVKRMSMGDACIMEFKVNETDPISNKRIMEIPWPQDTLVIAVIRNQHTLIPSGETLLQTNDDVMVATREQYRRPLARLFNKHIH